MELDNIVIYLIGIPAVGKYTVAKEIGRVTGARVVDNQLINTPVFSVLVDLTNISRWSEEVEVLRVPHPNALTVDTSYREPWQTAQLILEHVQRADQAGRPAAPGTAKGGA